jgi:hypothetical protein
MNCRDKISVAAIAAFLMSGAALAADEVKTAIGGGGGAAVGAAVGQTFGGKTGAIVGGALGGGAGAAVTTEGSGKTGAIVGGAVGGGAGAAVGQAVGGKTGAVVGAGVGGASGAVVGKTVGENNAQTASLKTASAPRYDDTRRVAYYDDDHDGRKGKKNHKKKDRCYEEHPGRGHAYGKYKDC